MELREEFLTKHLLDQFQKLSDVEPLSQRQQLAFQNFRAYAVGKMTASCVETFTTNYSAIMGGGFEGDLMTKMRLHPLCGALKKLGSEHVYSTSDVVRVEETGKHVLWGLLDIFYDELRYSPDSRLIKTFLPPTPKNSGDVCVSEQYKVAQRVADYVAGMTDTFAVSLYRRLTGVTAQ
jgi:dGTPase